MNSLLLLCRQTFLIDVLIHMLRAAKSSPSDPDFVIHGWFLFGWLLFCSVFQLYRKLQCIVGWMYHLNTAEVKQMSAVSLFQKAL